MFFKQSSWSLSFWSAAIETAIGSMLILSFAVAGCDDSSKKDWFCL